MQINAIIQKRSARKSGRTLVLQALVSSDGTHLHTTQAPWDAERLVRQTARNSSEHPRTVERQQLDHNPPPPPGHIAAPRNFCRAPLQAGKKQERAGTPGI